MYAFIAQLFAGNATPADANQAAHPAGSVARDLLESAGARAGLDPHLAEELRQAASAYLRVVR